MHILIVGLIFHILNQRDSISINKSKPNKLNSAIVFVSSLVFSQIEHAFR